MLGQELPALIRRGHTSLKVYMTYEAMRLSDREILDVLRHRAAGARHRAHPCREPRILTWLSEQLEREGRTAPKDHAASRPLHVEREATHRAVTLAEVADVPLVVVHISGGDPLEEVRRARARGLTVIAETCPQYLHADRR